MPFEYTDIEDDIGTRLIAKIDLPDDYAIIPMPEKQNQYKVNDKKVVITIAYSDSQFDPPDTLDIIKQNENVSIICNVKSAKLRGEHSVNEAFGFIKKFLVGFKPNNTGKLYLQKIEFDDRNEADNYFSYNVILVAKKLNVEVPDEVEDSPLLQEVFFRETVQTKTE